MNRYLIILFLLTGCQQDPYDAITSEAFDEDAIDRIELTLEITVEIYVKDQPVYTGFVEHWAFNNIVYLQDSASDIDDFYTGMSVKFDNIDEINDGCVHDYRAAIRELTFGPCFEDIHKSHFESEIVDPNAN